MLQYLTDILADFRTPFDGPAPNLSTYRIVQLAAGTAGRLIGGVGCRMIWTETPPRSLLRERFEMGS